jgi:hypothetical protein
MKGHEESTAGDLAAAIGGRIARASSRTRDKEWLQGCLSSALTHTRSSQASPGARSAENLLSFVTFVSFMVKSI